MAKQLGCFHAAMTGNELVVSIDQDWIVKSKRSIDRAISLICRAECVRAL